MLKLICLFISILTLMFLIEQYVGLYISLKMKVKSAFYGTLVLIETLVFALSTSTLIYIW